ncbi:SGNH/GDSL hydrolase family protein [Lentisphaera marina]|uniref:SGNH/GDSL hydrolase family protein n=1 Tax=Lentisphaera marina TaxID=1111041 RepID=UPI0023654641|nr:SGNH/GDSL hydrolase family protein [Lentisphaera marina]MDD7986689.1 SGNH/GDSL hydrolase family protein [Lentisphaera marina]
MNHIYYILIIIGLNSFGVEPGSFEEQAKAYKWQLQAEEGLPNVLILGDSISIGYTLDVRKILAGKANVYRPVAGDKPLNCGDTVSGLNNLKKWLNTQGVKKWDVIHFNWGLHDLKRIKPGTAIKKATDPKVAPRNSPEKYQENLSKLIEVLKQTEAKLIFATTTAYPSGVVPCRIPEDAKIYNEVAQKLMQKNQIVINDLYTFTQPRLKELQIPVNVHFTPKGSQSLAKEVSRHIAQALNLKL